MNKLAIDCIESWRKYLPDYEFKLWNEDNFDISSNQYVKEAYQAKKYAFVTDYVRLYALKEEGGIYMDTDVEVLKSFNDLLHHEAFSGFESPEYVPTGIMASVAHGEWVSEQIKFYNKRSFIKDDGSNDLTSNTLFITDKMVNGGFKLNNTLQIYKGMCFYPDEYFSPKRYGKTRLTDNTYCIHHFAGSWNSPGKRFKRWLTRNVLGENLTSSLVLIKKRFKNERVDF